MNRTMMKQTISVQALASQSQRGKPTYDVTAKTYPARVTDGGRERVDGTGRLIRPAHTIWVGSADHIHPDSKITLSTADVGSTEASKTSPPILGTPHRYMNERGRFTHTKIELG